MHCGIREMGLLHDFPTAMEATMNIMGKLIVDKTQQSGIYNSGLILGLHPTNERRRYKVTPSLIGWAQT